jgi:hypothetical protein
MSRTYAVVLFAAYGIPVLELEPCTGGSAINSARKLAEQNLICVCCWLAIYLTAANLLLESMYWLWDLCIDVVPDLTFKYDPDLLST